MHGHVSLYFFYLHQHVLKLKQLWSKTKQTTEDLCDILTECSSKRSANFVLPGQFYVSYPTGKDSVENYINFVTMNLFVFPIFLIGSDF